jgi:hypothetical protein
LPASTAAPMVMPTGRGRCMDRSRVLSRECWLPVRRRVVAAAVLAVGGTITPEHDVAAPSWSARSRPRGPNERRLPGMRACERRPVRSLHPGRARHLERRCVRALCRRAATPRDFATKLTGCRPRPEKLSEVESVQMCPSLWRRSAKLLQCNCAHYHGERKCNAIAKRDCDKQRLHRGR